ncbi:peroxiredoxin [Rhizobium sp. R72]|uniref:OsmC family protein n=1 Tax=unclassified Rhizobium TaxID=2613769 RepID=UPI000B52FE94|nr:MULTISPECIES: OsmC family protein [unclassified Rhizobium]OWV96025.1 peroxiredoxin [Rhizobium sp. R693]OWW01709.1 peroxiredoxin [Rhizobium sp. R72]OWW01812.1 peroxiredoxin [Rhizobium sp. R711]
MTTFSAEVAWERGAASFTDGRYSRGHTWSFDGGAIVAASASPHNVPLPYALAENVDPEEAYIAALSSCHMLFYLWLASRMGIMIDSYVDAATGLMETVQGRTMVSRVELRPHVTYAGDIPGREIEHKLHHEAHELCFLANSVKTEITVRLD